MYVSGEIPDRLLEASAREARFVIEKFSATEEHTVLKVALSFGLATEYLIMSSLASIDASLLADDKDSYSKLALSAAGTCEPLDIKRLRTVTYGAALKLLQQHRPHNIHKDVDAVMGVRNAAAHMAMATQTNNSDEVPALLRVVQGLHRYRPSLNEDDYWGQDCLTVVQNFRNAQASQQMAEFDTLLLSAKKRKKALDDTIAKSARDDVYVALEGRLMEEAASWDPKSRSASEQLCPACGRKGRVTWARYLWDDFEIVETYESVTGESKPAVFVTAESEAVAFNCFVCGLEIGESSVELLPNLQSKWLVHEERVQLTGDELDDYYQSLDGYEPDPDLWMGER